MANKSSSIKFTAHLLAPKRLVFFYSVHGTDSLNRKENKLRTIALCEPVPGLIVLDKEQQVVYGWACTINITCLFQKINLDVIRARNSARGVYPGLLKYFIDELLRES